MSTVLHQEIAPLAKRDFLPFNGTDYVEFYVGNASQAAYFYRLGFGMRWVSYAGPETGLKDRVSFVLQQGNIRFVFTTPLRPDTEVADHVHLHGDGVRDIALWVDDARQAWKETTRRGARSVREPFELKDAHGRVKMASIAAYGDIIHTFVERQDYRGAFLPGYREVHDDPLARPTGLLHVDHMAGSVGWNEMNRWINFYATVMGFSPCQRFDDRDVSTDYSALVSKVTANGNGRVNFPINEPAEGEPAEGLKKSQIEEYLKFYRGPGVQHIALATNDILYTVSKMRGQGIEFLKVPHQYYTELQGRIGSIDEPVGELERLGILVDRDEEGYILRIFTRPVEDRPTLFFEILQRKGRPQLRQRQLQDSL